VFESVFLFIVISVFHFGVSDLSILNFEFDHFLKKMLISSRLLFL
jgi:hypothetical protein